MESQTSLRHLIVSSFALQEIPLLCSDLDINPDSIAGDTIEVKAENLIRYCAQHAIRDQLIEQCRRLRPNSPWPKPPSPVAPSLTTLARRPFKSGLTSYDLEDRQIFAGRDRLVQRLTSLILDERIIVVNGFSGCGKTSVIRAGVMPKLIERGRAVIYASVHENVAADVLAQIRALDLDADLPQDTLDDLGLVFRRMTQHAGGPPVLIIDQFEKALDPARPLDELRKFVRSMSRWRDSGDHIVTVVLVMRIDWLPILEDAVRYLDLKPDVLSARLEIGYMTRSEAHDAIVEPLRKMGFSCDDAVVGEVLDELVREGVADITDQKFVLPVHLQIVSDSLLLQAESRDVVTVFDREAYGRTGGVASILQDYLRRTLRQHRESWRVLARFIGSGEQVSRSIEESDLVSVPAVEQIKPELEFLVAAGLLQAYVAGHNLATYYRLAHDYLVIPIVKYASEDDPSIQETRLASDWLATALRDYGSGTDFLLEQRRYERILTQRDNLRISHEARNLLMESALRYGKGWGHWLMRGDPSDDDARLALAGLLHDDGGTRALARGALHEAIETITPSKKDDFAAFSRELLIPQLATTFTTKTGKSRPVAGTALWEVRQWLPAALRYRVAAALSFDWVRSHVIPILTSLFVGLVVGAIGLALVYIRESNRGTWTIRKSLFAGWTPIVATDPRNDSNLFAVTYGGPDPRQGSTLLKRTGGVWHVVKSGFIQGAAGGLLIVANGVGRITMYVPVSGEGILRSDDEGETWTVMNRGLPSRAIVGLIPDPEKATTLYAATADFRGVLRSLDSGESWDFMDLDVQIFGAVITAIGISPTDDQELLVASQDGRIFAHNRKTFGWRLVSNWAKGSICCFASFRSEKASWMYAGTSQGYVLRSADGGTTWDVVGKPGSAEFNISSIVSFPESPQHIMVRAYGNGGNKLWESQDGGGNWEYVEAVGLPRTAAGIGFLPGPDSIMFAASSEGLFTSRDRAKSWSKESLPSPLATIGGLALGANGMSPVYAASGAGIYANSDGMLDDWRFGRGIAAETVRVVIADPVLTQTAFAGVMIIGQWSIYRTDDGGNSWRLTNPPRIDLPPVDTTALAAASAGNGDAVLYAGSLGCGVFKSLDRGANWDTFGRTRCGDRGTGNAPNDVAVLEVSNSNPNVLYASDRKQVYASLDGGVSWRTTEFRPATSVIALAVDPRESRRVFAATTSSGIFASDDSGNTWFAVENSVFLDSKLSAMEVVRSESGHLLVGATNGGIWETTDSGKRWESIREQLTIGAITSIVTPNERRHRIIVGTSQDGLAEYEPGRLP